jgi:hypothetical protein
VAVGQGRGLFAASKVGPWGVHALQFILIKYVIKIVFGYEMGRHGMTTRFDATEKKLREAQFFAGEIDTARRTREPECKEAIDFYLSAFLSAARSVYHVLKSKAPTVFPRWCDEWLARQSQEERNTFNAIRTGRDRSLKEGTQPTRENYGASVSPYPVDLQFFFEDDLPVTSREFLGRISPNDFEQDLVGRCRECIVVLTDMIVAFAETTDAPTAAE